MIAVINYNMGNLFSVVKALEFVGAEVKIISRPEELQHFDGCILPGVGNFGLGMMELRNRNFEGAILDFVDSGKPLLGICMGMQMLFDGSEEAPGVAGLGLIKGQVVEFDRSSGVKIPHMGWNQVKINAATPLFDGIEDNSCFYFVHSFYVKVNDEKNSWGVTDYVNNFTAVAGKSNVAGCQFHPEKSSDAGLRILKNFTRMKRVSL